MDGDYSTSRMAVVLEEWGPGDKRESGTEQKKQEHTVSFKASRVSPQREWTLDPECGRPSDRPGEHLEVAESLLMTELLDPSSPNSQFPL